MDAVGADGLFLLEGGVELFHPSVIRASMGTMFWKYVIQASFTDFLRWKQSNRVHLIGSSTHASKDYRTFVLPDRPTVLLLGNEQKGLSDQQIEACDEVVSIKMEGRVSSLNLAVAAGILLYQVAENKTGRHQVQPRRLQTKK
jgi:TrmH family RNA methyltransferase